MRAEGVNHVEKNLTHYYLDGHSGIEDCDFVIFEQCETHAQLKDSETFWQHRLTTFTP